MNNLLYGELTDILKSCQIKFSGIAIINKNISAYLLSKLYIAIHKCICSCLHRI